MPEPTLDAWAQIRHDYEHTDRPLAHICAEHGITVPMLRYRMRCWGWTRRKPLIPREGPPAVAAMERESEPPHHPTPHAFADASAGYPPPQEPAPGRAQARPGWEDEEVEIVPRLKGAVARVLPAIDATIARLAASTHPREMEQAGRTLSALTRALRELNALLSQHGAGLHEAEPPQDMDELRATLARRLHALIDARTGSQQPGNVIHAAEPGHGEAV